MLTAGRGRPPSSGTLLPPGKASGAWKAGAGDSGEWGKVGVQQRSPHTITSAMSSASPGLQSRSQRRGVMPLVLF